jgi:hypothetical protein
MSHRQLQRSLWWIRRLVVVGMVAALMLQCGSGGGRVVVTAVRAAAAEDSVTRCASRNSYVNHLDQEVVVSPNDDYTAGVDGSGGKTASNAVGTPFVFSYNGSTLVLRSYPTRVFDHHLYYFEFCSIEDEGWTERLTYPKVNGMYGTLADVSANGVRIVANFVNRTNDKTAVVAAMEFSNETDSWIMVGEVIETTVALGLDLSPDGNVVAIRQGAASFVTVSQWHEATESWKLLGEGETAWIVDPSNQDDSATDNLALSYNGSVLAIGDATRDEVMVYRYQNETWMQMGQTITGGDQFGHAVAISYDGTIVAVGAATANAQGNLFTGQVQVHRWENGLWVRLGPSINGVTIGDNFGFSISLSADGSVLVVGASGNGLTPGEGHLFVYDDTRSKWIEETVFADNPRTLTSPGAAVSADGLVVAMEGIQWTGFIEVMFYTMCNYTHTSSPAPTPLSTVDAPPLVTNATASEKNDLSTGRISETFVGVTLNLTGVGRLTDSDVTAFESLTVDFVESYYQTLDKDTLYSGLDLTTAILVTRQDVDTSIPTVQVTYTQTISHEPLPATAALDPTTLVQLPFLDRTAMEEYRGLLRNSSVTAFRSVQAVGVPVVYLPPYNERKDEPSDYNDFKAYTIVGLVVLFVTIGICVGWKLKQRQTKANNIAPSNMAQGPGTSASNGLSNSETDHIIAERSQLESPSLSSIRLHSSIPKRSQSEGSRTSAATQWVTAVQRLEPDGHRLFDAAAAQALAQLEEEQQQPTYKDQVREATVPMASVAQVSDESQMEDSSDVVVVRAAS